MTVVQQYDVANLDNRLNEMNAEKPKLTCGDRLSNCWNKYFNKRTRKDRYDVTTQ
jgi:hypothetical protein